MQVFVGKKCSRSHRAPNGIWLDGGRNLIGRRTESDRVAVAVRSLNISYSTTRTALLVYFHQIRNLTFQRPSCVYTSSHYWICSDDLSWFTLPFHGTIYTLDRGSSRLQMTMWSQITPWQKNIPPKGVSFSDIICIFAMSIVEFSCLFCNTKISEFFDMAKPWAARLCRLPKQVTGSAALSLSKHYNYE